MKSFALLTLTLAAMVLAGCSNLSGSSYGRYEARQMQQVRLGTVVAVRAVEIEGTKSGVGVAGGAALGGIGGSSIFGKKKADLAGAVAGAILGGLAGGAIENATTDQQGQLITVRLQDGQTVAITQGGQQQFVPGQPVQVLVGSDGTSRVVPM